MDSINEKELLELEIIYSESFKQQYAQEEKEDYEIYQSAVEKILKGLEIKLLQGLEVKDSTTLGVELRYNGKIISESRVSIKK